MVTAPVPGPVARDAARRELERSEYHHDDPGLLTRIVDWITRRLDALASHGLGGNALILLIVLVGVVVVALAIKAGRPTRRRRGQSTDEFDPLTPQHSRDHRRAAQELERAGDLAAAVREWLRAAVATIEERGVLPPRPGRTGTTTAREATPALPAAAAELTAAMAAFEQVWFGGRTANTDDVTLAHRAADAVAAARIVDAAGLRTAPQW